MVGQPRRSLPTGRAAGTYSLTRERRAAKASGWMDRMAFQLRSLRAERGWRGQGTRGGPVPSLALPDLPRVWAARKQCPASWGRRCCPAPAGAWKQASWPWPPADMARTLSAWGGAPLLLGSGGLRAHCNTSAMNLSPPLYCRANTGPPKSQSCGHSQGPQGAQLAEGVGSNFPDAVVLEATRAAREAG